jgi:hypothetical protein
MTNRKSLLSILFIAAFVLLNIGKPTPAQAQSGATVYAVTTSNKLISFRVNSPGTLLSSFQITGLPDGVSIVGIDIRPATGRLIALSSASRLYTLDVNSGAANAISGGSFSPGLSGGAFGFDFNPTVDRIRLTTDARQDLRLNPISGGVAATDGALTFAATDSNAGKTPAVVASAYTNNFNGSTSTTLYNIEASLNILVTQNPPNSGTLNTVGALGVDAGSLTSFDILSDRTGTDNAFAAINSTFYSINLATGAASAIGRIGGGESVRGIALATSVAMQMGVPMCADFDGSTTPIVRASIPDGGFFCRVLAKNSVFVNSAAASQLGNQAVISKGVIQAVDVFSPNGATRFSAGAKVCLQGNGNLFYLDATQSPRTPQLLGTTRESGYTCAIISNAGTLALTRNR